MLVSCDPHARCTETVGRPRELVQLFSPKPAAAPVRSAEAVGGQKHGDRPPRPGCIPPDVEEDQLGVSGMSIGSAEAEEPLKSAPAAVTEIAWDVRESDGVTGSAQRLGRVQVGSGQAVVARLTPQAVRRIDQQLRRERARERLLARSGEAVVVVVRQPDRRVATRHHDTDGRTLDLPREHCRLAYHQHRDRRECERIGAHETLI